MTVSEFHSRFGDKADYWGETKAYPVSDWQQEVSSGSTRLGYWDWVVNQWYLEDIEL